MPEHIKIWNLLARKAFGEASGEMTAELEEYLEKTPELKNVSAILFSICSGGNNGNKTRTETIEQAYQKVLQRMYIQNVPPPHSKLTLFG